MHKTESKPMQNMDTKKTQASAWGRGKTVEFVGEVKQELKKIEWTTKEELKTSTKVVLISTFCFAMFVYFIDIIMRTLLGGVDLLIKAIFG